MDNFFTGLSSALSLSPAKSPAATQSSPASRGAQVGVGLRLNSKLQVLEVVEGGAAANNGLIHVGDCLTSVDGTVVVGQKPQDITHLLLGSPGSIAALGIRRPDGGQNVIHVNRGHKQSVGVGMKLQRNDANEISVLEVARGGMAEELRVMPGDVIEAINGQNVLGWTITDATPLLRSSGGHLRVTFLRGAARERFVVEFEKGAATPGSTPNRGMTSTPPLHRRHSPNGVSISSPRKRLPDQIPGSATSPSVAAASDPIAKALEAQQALEEAHRKLAEAQNMVAEAARLKMEAAAASGTNTGAGAGGAGAGGYGDGGSDVGIAAGGSRRGSREESAALHASMMAETRTASSEAERDAAVRRKAIEAEEKRRAAWEQEEAEVAEELAVRLRASKAEAKRVRAWEEEEAKVAAEMEELKLQRISEEKRRLSHETEVRELAQELALENLRKRRDSLEHGEEARPGDVTQREIQVLERARLAEIKRAAAWESEEAEIAREMAEADAAQPNLGGLLDDEALCTLQNLREIEEKRQAAWDEEEERIAAELAVKAAALVAQEKLKVAWEQEEKKIAEEIDVLKAAAKAELKRREAWEVEEAIVAEEMGSMAQAERSRRISLTQPKVGSSRSSPPMNPRTDKDFQTAMDGDPFYASPTEIQDKYGAEPFVATKSQPEPDMGGIQNAIGDDYIPQGTSFPPPSFEPKMVQPPPATKLTASADYSADHPYIPQGDSYPPPTAFEGDMEDEWKGPRTTSSNSHGSVDRDSIQSLKREVITAADEAGQEFVRAEAERLRDAEAQIRRAAAELDARRWQRAAERESANSGSGGPSMAFEL